MREVVTVGLDLAKNVFQIHVISAEGKIIERRFGVSAVPVPPCKLEPQR